MAMLQELAFLDATAQAELVKRKEVKPIELVDAAIERIERLNPKLNAVITPMYDEARTVASREIPDGPFRGVPFLLKDVLASYAGVRMAGGCKFLGNYVPDHDCELVRRQKLAGLVTVGKTNLPELGLMATTEPILFGPTHNPWDLNRTTGGSSGGAGAAVAAGLVPMAHASDGGGSLRIPASCCGLFGLKPTRGRNPLGPDHGELASGLVAEHAVTRSVRDSAALLDATAGPDAGDPYYASPPIRPFLEEVGKLPGRLRIAFSTRAPGGAALHPDCVKATLDAARLCADLGHELVETMPELDGEFILHHFTILWSTWFARNMEDLVTLTGRPLNPEEFEPLSWALYEMGQKNSGPTFIGSLKTLHAISRKVGRFFVDFDTWLTPTIAEPPVPIGTFDAPPEDPMKSWSRVAEFVPFTRISNITGQPAMSIPLYWNNEGLPIGIHFVGRYGDEATLFRLASQLEAARPWAKRRPPISA